MSDKSSPTLRRIPDNVIGERRIAQAVKIRNLIEGLVLSVIATLIIMLIPFKIEVKILFSVVAFIVFTAFGCIGIKNRSITDFIYAVIRFRYKKRVYHLRSIKHVRKNGSKIGKNGEQLTYAEAVIFSIKTRRDEKAAEGEPFSIKDFVEAFKTVRM